MAAVASQGKAKK